MEAEQINPGQVLQRMRDFFSTGATLDYEFRKSKLQKLRNAILQNEEKIYHALKKDLGKSKEESYATEIGLVLAEISFAIKNLKKWMRPERIKTNLLNFPSTSRLYRDPYGLTLIIGAWNYPFQLLLAPLTGAIAAGNCCVLKPSEMASASSALIAGMIRENFDPAYINVFEGEGSEVVPALMNSTRFDYIFYTGGTEVGRTIYRAAAEKLIPVTLELGGKSPAVVEKEADIKTTARRIALGKFLNAGQTCVAPDYVLVQKEKRDELIDALIQTTKTFFGDKPELSYDYGRIINEKHFDHLLKLLPEENKIVYGGKHKRDELYMGPAIVESPDLKSALMQKEIFGPILPVIGYENKEEALRIIRDLEKPLSFYLFTKNKKNKKWWMKNVPFGGGCINNTLWHLSNPNLPFGGVGDSGIGAYHGKFTFITFSHSKPVLDSPTWFDPGFKYPSFKNLLGLFKRFIK